MTEFTLSTRLAGDDSLQLGGRGGGGIGALVPLGQTQDITATYWQVAPPVIAAQRVTLAH